MRTDEGQNLDVISLIGNVLYQHDPLSLSFSQPQVRRPLFLPFLVNKQTVCCSSKSPAATSRKVASSFQLFQLNQVQHVTALGADYALMYNNIV